MRIEIGELSLDDVRTVMEWASSLTEFRQVHTTAARFDDDEFASFELLFEADADDHSVRGLTIGSAYKRAAELIRSGDLDQELRGDFGQEEYGD